MLGHPLPMGGDQTLLLLAERRGPRHSVPRPRTCPLGRRDSMWSRPPLARTRAGDPIPLPAPRMLWGSGVHTLCHEHDRLGSETLTEVSAQEDVNATGGAFHSRRFWASQSSVLESEALKLPPAPQAAGASGLQKLETCPLLTPVVLDSHPPRRPETPPLALFTPQRSLAGWLCARPRAGGGQRGVGARAGETSSEEELGVQDEGGCDGVGLRAHLGLGSVEGGGSQEPAGGRRQEDHRAWTSGGGRGAGDK